jgi:hypothetical protein
VGELRHQRKHRYQMSAHTLYSAHSAQCTLVTMAFASDGHWADGEQAAANSDGAAQWDDLAGKFAERRQRERMRVQFERSSLVGLA